MFANEEILHIAYATDDNYLMPTLVAAASAVAWASEPDRIVIHVLDIGVSDYRWQEFADRLRLLCRKVGLERHVIDESRFSGMRRWHGSLAAYARIFLPELLPNAVWCVYCDGDTLFTDDPLKLFKVFDDRCGIQGHKDWLNEDGIKTRSEWYAENGYTFDYGQYFCSGFLLINLKWFRENNGTRACVDFLAEHPTAMCPDQDALAIVCRGYVGWVPDEWGMFSVSVYRGNERRPSCIHYASELPWDFSFNWHVGYYDVKLLWVEYASCLLGMEPADFGGPGRILWRCQLLYHSLMKFVSYVLFILPVFRNKYAWVYERFGQGKVSETCALEGIYGF